MDSPGAAASADNIRSRLCHNHAVFCAYLAQAAIANEFRKGLHDARYSSKLSTHQPLPYLAINPSTQGPALLPPIIRSMYWRFIRGMPMFSQRGEEYLEQLDLFVGTHLLPLGIQWMVATKFDMLAFLQHYLALFGHLKSQSWTRCQLPKSEIVPIAGIFAEYDYKLERFFIEQRVLRPHQTGFRVAPQLDYHNDSDTDDEEDDQEDDDEAEALPCEPMHPTRDSDKFVPNDETNSVRCNYDNEKADPSTSGSAAPDEDSEIHGNHLLTLSIPSTQATEEPRALGNKLLVNLSAQSIEVFERELSKADERSKDDPSAVDDEGPTAQSANADQPKTRTKRRRDTVQLSPEALAEIHRDRRAKVTEFVQVWDEFFGATAVCCLALRKDSAEWRDGAGKGASKSYGDALFEKFETAETIEDLDEIYKTWVDCAVKAFAHTLDNMLDNGDWRRMITTIFEKMPWSFVLTSLKLFNPIPFVERILRFFLWRPAGFYSLFMKFGAIVCALERTNVLIRKVKRELQMTVPDHHKRLVSIEKVAQAAHKASIVSFEGADVLIQLLRKQYEDDSKSTTTFQAVRNWLFGAPADEPKDGLHLKVNGSEVSLKPSTNISNISVASFHTSASASKPGIEVPELDVVYCRLLIRKLEKESFVRALGSAEVTKFIIHFSHIIPPILSELYEARIAQHCCNFHDLFAEFIAVMGKILDALKRYDSDPSSSDSPSEPYNQAGPDGPEVAADGDEESSNASKTRIADPTKAPIYQQCIGDIKIAARLFVDSIFGVLKNLAKRPATDLGQIRIFVAWLIQQWAGDAQEDLGGNTNVFELMNARSTNEIIEFFDHNEQQVISQQLDKIIELMSRGAEFQPWAGSNAVPTSAKCSPSPDSAKAEEIDEQTRILFDIALGQFYERCCKEVSGWDAIHYGYDENDAPEEEDTVTLEAPSLAKLLIRKKSMTTSSYASSLASTSKGDSRARPKKPISLRSLKSERLGKLGDKQHAPEPAETEPTDAAEPKPEKPSTWGWW
ncbi:uncharacterized protein BJ171DRAFT_582407 [Polychytrium aggregatum]|uniref:uncharacterized protein n=1 Tax=Polychytrium aggregatum TaxID=110093 RepID=UPI0022FEB566|nr:uncharacterized protein BJ171DRAFT_582407 [Polychytrium aggregatum]KAI9204031.1 hypothetical protein BJ171DRAFT_582407 [Polychytrium aggregatum]